MIPVCCAGGFNREAERRGTAERLGEVGEER
mgnify:CR=1 FL=1